MCLSVMLAVIENMFGFLEGACTGNSDTDRQLLEASKSGDLEVVKVRTKNTPQSVMFFSHVVVESS